MSTPIRFSLAFALLAAVATPALADETVVEETRTTTTTSEGTVSQVSPERIVIRSSTSPDPITYTQTKTTTYVDEDGHPVAVETVKTGAPVTVFYDKAGDRMTATRVVVQKRRTVED
jgi:hypothetical protein